MSDLYNSRWEFILFYTVIPILIIELLHRAQQKAYFLCTDSLIMQWRQKQEFSLISGVMDANNISVSKGHGSGRLYNSPQRNAPPYLPCVLSNTAHLPVPWKFTKPAQINGGTDTKTVPASKTKGQCAGNTPNTLILANWRLRSKQYYVCCTG